MRTVGLTLALAIALTAAAGLVLAQVADTTGSAGKATVLSTPTSTATPTASPIPDKPPHPMKGPGPDGGRGKGGPGGRDGPNGLGPERPFPMFRDVTDQEITDILAFIDINMPWMRPDLDKMRQAEPDRFRQVCRHLRFEIDQLKDLKAKDPAGFSKAIEERQLRARAKDLLTKVRAATDPKEAEALKNQLHDVLGKLFDAELATRKAQIARLEQQLGSLREDLQKRAAARDDIVATRLTDVLNGKTDAIGHEPEKTDKPDKPAKPDRTDGPGPDKTGPR
jgi:hypothetical protein